MKTEENKKEEIAENCTEKLSSNESKLLMIRHTIKQSDANEKSNNCFSVYVSLNDQPNKKLPIVDKEKGLDTFNAAIDSLDKIDVHTLFVTTFKSKKERTGIEWRLDLGEGLDIVKTVSSAVSHEMENYKESLAGNLSANQGMPLGEIQYKHMGEVLQLKAERQMEQLNHQNTIAELNRQLQSSLDTNEDNENLISKLEKENESLEKEFDDFKNDKLSGMSSAISSAGGQILGNLAKQFIPGIIGGGAANVSGISENSNKATMVEGDDHIGLILDQIRLVVTPYDDDTLLKFYSIMEIIALDKNNLDTILKFLKPNNES